MDYNRLADKAIAGEALSREEARDVLQTPDDRVLELLEAAFTVRRTGGAVVLTADHGNLEQMVDYETGQPHTAHTLNPVPCIIVDDKQYAMRASGVLADIAPTILTLMGLPQPPEMTGVSLIKE